MVMDEKITTTKPKAKEIQPYVERLVTKAKTGQLHQRRLVLARVTTEEAAAKLFNDLAKRFANRNGGYTRIRPAGYRRGDNAAMATLSFTEEPPKAEKPVHRNKNQVASSRTKASEAKSSEALGKGREKTDVKK